MIFLWYDEIAKKGDEINELSKITLAVLPDICSSAVRMFCKRDDGIAVF